MQIDTSYLQKCNTTLKSAYAQLQQHTTDEIKYSIYRAAVIKEFEIILELAGKLLRKTILPFLHSAKAVDKLYFKDIFRQAGLHNVLKVDEVQRWLKYRDNLNKTSHDYGEDFADNTLPLIDRFVVDVDNLIKVINEHVATNTG
jgi:nucleotidyltransferase substrate binding protein (TIGR01987 family)